MNKKQFSNEPVKKALSETTRAISKKNDLTINFENETTKINQSTIPVSYTHLTLPTIYSV